MTDPNWPRASAWLGGDNLEETIATLQVIGAPVRLGSISGGRFDLAPQEIRAALERFSTYDGEVDVRAVRVRDSGDLALASKTPEESLDEISGAVGGSLPHSDALVILGGDNSITRPGVRGLGPDLKRIGLLTLDAHHDLRDTADGLSNGNPVRALLEDGLPGSNIAQIGIQAFANSPAYAEVAKDQGIKVCSVELARARGVAGSVEEALEELDAHVDAIYVDLDVDVLDRAFAPACPGSRPGGLTPWEVQAAARICGEFPKVRAIDIVEVDPKRDVKEVTTLAAASFVLSFAAGLTRRGAS
ncbi:MAG: agmatinase family protein [Actinomycetota bacterium]